MEKQLVNYNIPYERFNAIKTKRFGALGCTKSHCQVLKKAMEQNLKNVLILEDDFDFTINRNAFESIMTTVFNTDFNWDVILLTANMKVLKSTKVSQPYLQKVTDAQIAAAYIINGHYISKLFNRLNEGAFLLEKHGKKFTRTYINDQYWKELQKTDNWYITNPILGIQREDYSDIEEKNVKYY
jgi:glycosyl transferase, family 25